MITQADMNKVLQEVNRVLANLDKRITDLEQVQKTTRTPAAKKATENT